MHLIPEVPMKKVAETLWNLPLSPGFAGVIPRAIDPAHRRTPCYRVGLLLETLYLFVHLFNR